MDSSEIIRTIEKAGWQHVTTGGEHWQFKHPSRPGRVTVPRSTRDQPLEHVSQRQEAGRPDTEVAPMTAYIGLIRKDRGSDFGVDFPDFSGCITAGRSMDEARRMGAEALALHVQGMIEDKEPIPEPSSLDGVMGDPGNRNGVAFLVEVATQPAEAVRINVMLPEDVIKAIDRTTTSRSRFLAEAARMKLQGMT